MKAHRREMGQCPEWQRGRTVNPLADAFVGSSPTWPTWQVLRPTAKHLQSICANLAYVAQLAEHALGKGEVMGSNPIVGSACHKRLRWRALFLFLHICTFRRNQTKHVQGEI